MVKNNFLKVNLFREKNNDEMPFVLWTGILYVVMCEVGEIQTTGGMLGGVWRLGTAHTWSCLLFGESP